MSTHKKPTKLRVAPSNAVAQIDALSESLGYAPAVPKAQAQMLRGRGTAVPVTVIELLANLADQHGGTIAGLPFDAAAARDALARAKSARSVANAARRLSRRAVSDALQNLAVVGDESMAIALALDRITRNPRGNAFVEANDQIRSLMRRTGHTRKAAAKGKTPSTTTSTTPPHAVVAPVNALGTPSTATPS
jgi:hypothetical protein